jgi:adenylate cyclase
VTHPSISGPPAPPVPPEPPPVARAREALQRTNNRQGLIRTIRAAREMLPGDENFGDELSTAGDKPSEVIARYLSEQGGRGGTGADDGARGGTTVATEAGLAALQVWQALSQRVGRGAGEVEATILFTDLVEFSSWVLEAGDEAALQLLRAVAGVVEPAIHAGRGRVVKRLGDGHMAVFSNPGYGVEAALAMQEGLCDVEVGGHRPRLRAGLHRGVPRRLGGDYLGTDVNIAARVAEAAGPGEVLVSAAVVAGIEPAELSGMEFKRRRWFRAKGAPRDLEVFTVRRVG